MFLLTLLWLALGGILGFIVIAAHLQPSAWSARSWPRMCALGAMIALASGWLGTWLLGRYFATPLALWVTIVGLATLPHGLCWLSQRTSWHRFMPRRLQDN